MDRAYRYRRIVPMTYEQYLDEPVDVIEWTLRIHALDEERRNRRRGPDGAPGAA
jgi:hypothetical protein